MDFPRSMASDPCLESSYSYLAYDARKPTVLFQSLLFLLFQIVFSFIKDIFHKQSWYFRQDMGNLKQYATTFKFSS
jgi:hypothetical protein